MAACTVTVRAIAILCCAVLLPLMILLAARPEVRSLDQLALMGSWAALVTAYVLFWFALAVMVNWSIAKVALIVWFAATLLNV